MLELLRVVVMLGIATVAMGDGERRKEWKIIVAQPDANCSENCYGRRIRNRCLVDDDDCDVVMEDFLNCSLPILCDDVMMTIDEGKCKGKCNKAVRVTREVCRINEWCSVKRTRKCKQPCIWHDVTPCTSCDHRNDGWKIQERECGDKGCHEQHGGERRNVTCDDCGDVIPRSKCLCHLPPISFLHDELNCEDDDGNKIWGFSHDCKSGKIVRWKDEGEVEWSEWRSGGEQTKYREASIAGITCQLLFQVKCSTQSRQHYTSFPAVYIMLVFLSILSLVVIAGAVWYVKAKPNKESSSCKISEESNHDDSFSDDIDEVKGVKADGCVIKIMLNDQQYEPNLYADEHTTSSHFVTTPKMTRDYVPSIHYYETPAVTSHNSRDEDSLLVPPSAILHQSINNKSSRLNEHAVYSQVPRRDEREEYTEMRGNSSSPSYLSVIATTRGASLLSLPTPPSCHDDASGYVELNAEKA